MLIRPEPGVVPNVSKSGQLELFSPSTGAWFRCSPTGAAVWIALRQHQGRLDPAADMLAAIWQESPDRIRGAVWHWAGEFRDAGLISFGP